MTRPDDDAPSGQPTATDLGLADTRGDAPSTPARPDSAPRSAPDSRIDDDSVFSDPLFQAVASAPAVHLRPLRGDRIGGRFEVIEPLGEGGMGVVVLARDLDLGRRVAIKLLRPPEVGSRTREATADLLREARATASLNHRHIVSVFDLGSWRGQPYIVMEYLEGRPLSELAEQAPLPPYRALELVRPIVEGLVHAHDAGIVHRDLKPSNVFVLDDGTPKILDFGIAGFDAAWPASASGPWAPRGGTPGYAAPEQWHSAVPDARSDIWAVGVILFELLVGRRPFAGVVTTGEPPETTAPRVCDLAPGLSEELDRLVARALRPDPAERFQTARELLDDLRPIERSQAHPGEVVGEPYRFLEPFTEADNAWFFGRETETNRLLSMLRTRPFVSVVGPPGSGKSSLVRAGLFSRLRRGATPWTNLSIRPGRRPLQALASAIDDVCRPDTPLLPERLAAAPGRAGQLLREHARRSERDVLVFVDQFEEIYAQVDDPEIRHPFAAALLSIADDASGPLRVVIALREDFLHELSDEPRLRDLVAANVFLLGPPNAESMVSAIEGPAKRLGFELEPGLTDEMVASLRAEATPLAMLQLAASRLWERRERERRLLTRDALRQLGGVQGVLAAHADEVLRQLDSHDRPFARQLLCRLVTPSGTRARVEREALLGRASDPEAAGRVLDHLVRGRLVTLADDEGVAVELTSDVLIGHWQQLATWLAEDPAARRFLERLEGAAAAWVEHGRPRGLLWSGQALAAAVHFESQGADRLSDAERAFVTASARAERRSRRLRRGLLGGFIAFLIAVTVGSVIGLELVSEARKSVEDTLHDLYPFLLDRDLSGAAGLASRACSQGQAGFCTVLGRFYQDGYGVPEDPDRARELYDRACNHGDLRGCSFLAAFVWDSAHDADRARGLLERACDGGEAHGCAGLGVFELQGVGGPRDPTRAATLLERACGAGDSEGCAYLGYLYRTGEGVARDLERARALLESGCDNGGMDACRFLAELYVSGDGVESDVARASDLLRRACDAGETASCRQLAELYEAGRLGTPDPLLAFGLYALACQGGRRGVVDRSLWEADLQGCLAVVRLADEHAYDYDLERAATVLERACERGELLACWRRGRMLARGLGGEPDRAGALALYEQTCDAGLLEACTDLGHVWSEDPPTDLAGAVGLFERTCDAGEPRACFELGSLVELGRGVEPDPARAVMLFERACQGEVGLACVTLGLHEYIGLGVEGDAARAAQLYSRGCELGDASGCAFLGSAYQSGDGVTADANQARQLYERACDGGEEWTCYFLAELYREGGGVEPDATRARQLYERSCETGYPRACARLGAQLARGEGGERDPQRAQELLARACASEPFNCHELALFLASTPARSGDAERIGSLEARACEHGQLDACVELAHWVESGQADAATLPGAADLYGQACDQGHQEACVELGRSYLEGGATERPDPARGAEVLRAPCSSGQPEACFLLARLHEDGLGVERDLSRARELAERSCQGGFSNGCTLAGWYAETGRGATESLVQAQSLYEQACRGGDDEGCARLGLLLLGGPDGTPGSAWLLEMACRQGSEAACERQSGPLWD